MKSMEPEVLSNYLYPSLFVSFTLLLTKEWFYSQGMALVVFSIQTMQFYVPDQNQQTYIIYTPFHPTQEDTYVAF